MSKPQALVNDPLEAAKRGAVAPVSPAAPPAPTPPSESPPEPPAPDTRAPEEPAGPPPEPAAPVQYRVKARKEGVSLGSAGIHTLHKGKVLSVEFYAAHKDRLAEQGVELEPVLA